MSGWNPWPLEKPYMLIGKNQMYKLHRGPFMMNGKLTTPRQQVYRRMTEQSMAVAKRAMGIGAGAVKENKEIISWERYLSEEKKRKVQESKGKKTVRWEDLNKETT